MMMWCICIVWQVAHAEVMKSIERAICKVEEKLSHGGGDLTGELQANLKYVPPVKFLEVFFCFLWI